jgi:AraC family transcriptional regulator
MRARSTFDVAMRGGDVPYPDPMLSGVAQQAMNPSADPNAARRMNDLIPLLLDVEHGLDRDLSLATMARKYGYSPFHFHRFFSQTVGETPKQHVERLRLERAAYHLAVTDDSILEIAVKVGFKNHETFSRAFKRAVSWTPSNYRRACRQAQRERLERNRDFRGDGCQLSEVRFTSLPSMLLMAVRRYGAYAECPAPFRSDDDLWTGLARWSEQKALPHCALPLVISYDDPTVTPGPMQRLDACLPCLEEFLPEGAVRRLEFAGGRFGGIEHIGPLATILQAYRNLADGIRRSDRYCFDEGPPVQLYRKVHVGGDPAVNVTEVYFPVREKPRTS